MSYGEDDTCMSYEEDTYMPVGLYPRPLSEGRRMHVMCGGDTCMSYEEEDACMHPKPLSCQNGDACMSSEEEDTFMSYEEEDTCLYPKL
jgi:hypothetical protein